MITVLAKPWQGGSALLIPLPNLPRNAINYFTRRRQTRNSRCLFVVKNRRTVYLSHHLHQFNGHKSGLDVVEQREPDMQDRCQWFKGCVFVPGIRIQGLPTIGAKTHFLPCLIHRAMLIGVLSHLFTSPPPKRVSSSCAFA